MPNQTHLKRVFLLISILLLITLSCINLDALSSLREYFNISTPENTL